MDFEELKVYLPKFLSSDSERALFEGLKDFPHNIDSRLYTLSLQDEENIFQGDGISDLLVTNLPDTTIKPAKCMVLSNSCDASFNNTRNFPSNLVYAPIVNLKKYHELLIKSSTKSKKDINTHIKSIKKQRITQIFYLPKLNNHLDESIIFLDRVNSCSIEYLKSKSIQKERFFTLSDYGAYLFVLKLSIHFSRIKDNVDRFKGIVK